MNEIIKDLLFIVLGIIIGCAVTSFYAIRDKKNDVEESEDDESKPIEEADTEISEYDESSESDDDAQLSENSKADAELGESDDSVETASSNSEVKEEEEKCSE